MPQTEVDDELHEALYAIARANGVSVYDVCRRAFREFVDNNPDLAEPTESED